MADRSPTSLSKLTRSWIPQDYSKLWHDDIRRPPDDSWYWARTNQDAMRYLLAAGCQEASLDHDLGAHDVDPDHPDSIYVKGGSDETGVDLVKAMLLLKVVPPKVTIHSWNPQGAEYMAGMLRSLSGAEVVVRPYEVPRAA